MPTCSYNNDSSLKKFFLWGLIITATVAGIYLRLKGLGKAPFTVDEYYIAASVRNILERGLPEFACGGSYTRGLFYQYILAPLFAYGSNDEFYARLVTVACNIFTAPALYLLAKNISGRTVACAVTVLFFLSVWEIEFSRFARMYAPFQMVFIWYVFFLHKWIFLYNKHAKTWCYTLSFFSIFVYEGGIFLILMNFIPPLIDRKHFHKSGISINAAILAFAYFYLTNIFGLEKLLFNLPATKTIAASTSSHIIMPPIMASSLSFGNAWFTLFIIILSIIIFTGIKLIKQLIADHSDTSIAYKIILVSLLVILSMANAYTLIFSIVILSLALNWITIKDLISRRFLPIISSVALMLGFWITYGLFTDQWINAIDPEGQTSAKQLLIALFKYPDVYDKFIYIFFKTLPVLTASTGLLILTGIIEAMSKDYRDRKEYLFIVAIVTGLVLSVCMLRQPYITTRYVFFLYPLILLLVIMTVQNFLPSMVRNKQKHYLIITGFLLVFMLISEDYSLRHYFNIDSDDILYRNHYDNHMEKHLYARWDFRTPAEIVNKNRKPGDIVITSTYATPYYLDNLDYFYNDVIRDNFQENTACNGQKNLWSNVEQVSKPKDLLDLISHTKNTVWLITRSVNYRWKLPIEATLEQRYEENKIYQTVDGNLNLYKIP